MKIIDIELYKLNENLKINDTEYKDIELKYDDKVKKFIYKHGIDKNFGARPLKRYIEKNIGTPLASKLLKEEMDIDSIINMSIKRNKIVMDAVRKIEEAPFYIGEEYKENKTLSAEKSNVSK
jgi:ATP-dependent Clp protease ATP-binding subunit ClpB